MLNYLLFLFILSCSKLSNQGLKYKMMQEDDSSYEIECQVDQGKGVSKEVRYQLLVDILTGSYKLAIERYSFMEKLIKGAKEEVEAYVMDNDYYGSQKVLTKVMEYNKANIISLDFSLPNGDTPLISIIKTGQLDLVYEIVSILEEQELLESQKTIRDANGWLALAYGICCKDDGRLYGLLQQLRFDNHTLVVCAASIGAWDKVVRFMRISEGEPNRHDVNAVKQWLVQGCPPSDICCDVPNSKEIFTAAVHGGYFAVYNEIARNAPISEVLDAIVCMAEAEAQYRDEKYIVQGALERAVSIVKRRLATALKQEDLLSVISLDQYLELIKPQINRFLSQYMSINIFMPAVICYRRILDEAHSQGKLAQLLVGAVSSRRSNAEIVADLLRRGMDPTADEYLDCLDLVNKDKQAIRFIFSNEFQLKEDIMTKFGMPYNNSPNRYSDIFFYLMKIGDTKGLSRIIASEFDINDPIRTPYGKVYTKPFAVAVHGGRDDMFKFLVDNGAISDGVVRGRTAVGMAVSKGDWQLAQDLQKGTASSGNIAIMQRTFDEHLENQNYEAALNLLRIVEVGLTITPNAILSSDIRNNFDLVNEIIRKGVVLWGSHSNGLTSFPALDLDIDEKIGGLISADIELEQSLLFQSLKSSFRMDLSTLSEDNRIAFVVNERATLKCINHNLYPESNKEFVEDISNSFRSGYRLIAAARVGWVERVEELLDEKYVIDAPDDEGKTALMWAVEKGELGVAELLIARGARFDSAKKEGFVGDLLHVLDYAAISPDVKVLGVVLCAREFEQNHLDKGLAISLKAGKESNARVFIDKGAVPRLKDAIAGGLEGLTQALLEQNPELAKGKKRIVGLAVKKKFEQLAIEMINKGAEFYNADIESAIAEGLEILAIRMLSNPTIDISQKLVSDALKIGLDNFVVEVFKAKKISGQLKEDILVFLAHNIPDASYLTDEIKEQIADYQSVQNMRRCLSKNNGRGVIKGLEEWEKNGYKSNYNREFALVAYQSQNLNWVVKMLEKFPSIVTSSLENSFKIWDSLASMNLIKVDKNKFLQAIDLFINTFNKEKHSRINYDFNGRSLISIAIDRRNKLLIDHIAKMGVSINNILVDAACQRCDSIEVVQQLFELGLFICPTDLDKVENDEVKELFLKEIDLQNRHNMEEIKEVASQIDNPDVKWNKKTQIIYESMGRYGRFLLKKLSKIGTRKAYIDMWQRRSATSGQPSNKGKGKKR